MYHEFTKTGFVADGIIAHMREEHYPSDESAVFLDRLPLIDALRQRIGEDDVPWLLSIVENDSGPTAGLACSLLRKHIHRREVKNCFETRWNTANPYLQNRLMWRMLDDPNLPQEWHRRFFDFILAEWNTFRDFNRAFYGTQQVINRILSRIGDPSYPDSKKWIYLCCVPDVVEDHNAAKALINLERSISDPFSHEVAEVLLKRFFTDQGDEGSEERAAQEDTCEEKSIALDFVADAVVSYLQAGHRPTDEEAEVLNQLPVIDALRACITEGDLPWIVDVVEKESGEVAAFYLSLLKRFDLQEDIKTLLRKRWETANAFFRAHLMWRILDDPDLPEEWHRKIFNLVLEEWPTFREVTRKFMGAPETIVSQALRRIGDPSYPDTKKWVNLCRLPEIAEDQEAAKALINIGLSMKDPFLREVAKVLMERFFTEDTK